MKSREFACIHYVCEGNCDLGKDGTFNKKCQTCKSYRKKAGTLPRRTDTRTKRKEREVNRELRYEIY